MKKYNLIWIVVDSVRSYKTGLDDRDRLDVMDKLAEDGIDFANAISSAPSSALSASTMFTGVPACFISRHFNDWQFDEKKIASVQNTLKNRGYLIYATHDAPEGRVMLRKLIHTLPPKYCPPGISCGDYWINKQTTDVLKHFLENNNRLFPAFYLLWYDCRRDPTTSDEVARALALFKEHGLYENSVIVMCSDHGYPDPASGLTEETMKKYTHDMIVTDDNIKVPLILRYPNCPKGLKIDEVVGLIDLFPTICEILDIPPQNQQFKYKGESLLRTIDKKDSTSRIIRTDTRLHLASGRVTALRSNQYKYVYYWDQDTEEFYNLHDDPYETKNLLSENQGLDTTLREFRHIKDDMEEEINKYHIEELHANFDRNISKHISNKERGQVLSLLLTAKKAPRPIVECFLESAKKSFPKSKVELLVSEKDYSSYQGCNFDEVISLKELSPAKLAKSAARKKEYDMVFYLTEQSKQCFIEEDMTKIIKGMKTRYPFMLDYNFKIYSKFLSNWFWPLKNYILRNSSAPFYKDEPTLIFKDIVIFIKILLGRIRKQKADFLDANKAKKLRDRELKTSKKITDEA